MGDKPDTGTEDKKRMDLSVPQVAGSALAAVAAAVLASTLGVYGTFIGAGVVSVVATCGGTVFQHFFKRTGEQLREVTVQAKVGSRQVPVLSPYKIRRDDGAHGKDDRDRGEGVHDATALLPRADDERTRLLGRIDADPTRMPPRADADRTQMLGQVDRTQLLKRADRTQLLKPVDGTRLPPGAEPAKEFNEASVHGTRLRGWKRPLLAAAVVFGVSMGGITAYELISGGEVGGHGGGTTLQSVFTGGAKKQDPPAPADPGGRDHQSPGTGGSPTPSGDDGKGTTGGSGTDDPTATPSPSTSHGSGTGSDSGSGSGSGSGGTTPTPTPTPSGSKGSGSGSADPVTPDPKSGASSAP
ncbi:hypothetical protein [Streptomyces sp. NBC_00083]|uniref:hypothetical protein n=1 Tax=Streptomyces sp. NBC_00083 TaxID=2975647 RepID=UPI002251C318|nr:hypothetical protein [Streptomyces sp. NBC_00083]MCX5386168.1 hypothetical protein [Streptomyces sp. NBC_00083]